LKALFGKADAQRTYIIAEGFIFHDAVKPVF
jgi:hypothetical protein